MDGFLEKIDGIWYVKWSDLHSFAHGTHWMITQFHPEQIIDETLYKEGDMVEIEFTYPTYDDNYIPKYYAILIKSK
jgi:hypothetical protein